jgi:hypothetical protein
MKINNDYKSLKEKKDLENAVDQGMEMLYSGLYAEWPPYHSPQWTEINQLNTFHGLKTR